MHACYFSRAREALTKAVELRNQCRGGFVLRAPETTYPKSWRLYFQSLEAVSRSHGGLLLSEPCMLYPYPGSFGGYISEAWMLFLRSPEVYISGALEALSLATYISDAMEALSPESTVYLRSLEDISLEPPEELYNLKPGDYILGTPETISMSNLGHIFGAMKPPSGAVKAPLGVIEAEGPSLDMWKPN